MNSIFHPSSRQFLILYLLSILLTGTAVLFLCMNHYYIQISFIPNTALDIMIKEIEKKKMKGQFLKARISVACQPVLRIKNLSGDIEEDFLKDYFKNKKRSGGGNIEFFEMSREREAVVKFCDPNGKVTGTSVSLQRPIIRYHQCCYC